MDALEVGIPVMNDMTFLLDNGFEVTFQTGAPDTPFNSGNLSGGLADINMISITHKNQSLTITDVNTPTPNVGSANLDGYDVDANLNDGYVLLESGGVHSWEYDGLSTGQILSTNPNDMNEQISGYFARKVVFQSGMVSEFNPQNLSELSVYQRMVNFHNNGTIGDSVIDNDAWTTSALKNKQNNTTAEEAEFLPEGRPVIQISDDKTEFKFEQYESPEFGEKDEYYVGVLEQEVSLIGGLKYTLNTTFNNESDANKFKIEVIDASTGDTIYEEEKYDPGSADDLHYSKPMDIPSDGEYIVRYTDYYDPEHFNIEPSFTLKDISLIATAEDNPILNEETEAGAPDPDIFMNVKEKELLTDILQIPFTDASGIGLLSLEEWQTLKDSLINARNNLNGSSQLQTVQLQRAMLVYNQNYEALSNSQQKIYNLLKDITSNMK